MIAAQANHIQLAALECVQSSAAVVDHLHVNSGNESFVLFIPVLIVLCDGNLRLVLPIAHDIRAVVQHLVSVAAIAVHAASFGPESLIDGVEAGECHQVQEVCAGVVQGDFQSVVVHCLYAQTAQIAGQSLLSAFDVGLPSGCVVCTGFCGE